VQVAYEIYLLSAPGFWYVGSTSIGVERRLQRHLSGRGGAKKLYAKIQELGAAAFTLTVVERARGNPTEAEQCWYDFFVSVGSGQPLQQRPGGYPDRAGKPAWNRGISPTPETVAKRQASWAATKPPACPRGHLYDEENTLFYPNGRRCRQCNIDRCKARRSRLD
jgi:hypothetical protein